MLWGKHKPEKQWTSRGKQRLAQSNFQNKGKNILKEGFLTQRIEAQVWWRDNDPQGNIEKDPSRLKSHSQAVGISPRKMISLIKGNEVSNKFTTWLILMLRQTKSLYSRRLVKKRQNFKDEDCEIEQENDTEKNDPDEDPEEDIEELDSSKHKKEDDEVYASGSSLEEEGSDVEKPKEPKDHIAVTQDSRGKEPLVTKVGKPSKLRQS